MNSINREEGKIDWMLKDEYKIEKEKIVAVVNGPQKIAYECIDSQITFKTR